MRAKCPTHVTLLVGDHPNKFRQRVQNEKLFDRSSFFCFQSLPFCIISKAVQTKECKDIASEIHKRSQFRVRTALNNELTGIKRQGELVLSSEHVWNTNTPSFCPQTPTDICWRMKEQRDDSVFVRCWHLERNYKCCNVREFNALKRSVSHRWS
jgi:hypothetical protein